MKDSNQKHPSWAGVFNGPKHFVRMGLRSVLGSACSVALFWMVLVLTLLASFVSDPLALAVLVGGVLAVMGIGLMGVIYDASSPFLLGDDIYHDAMLQRRAWMMLGCWDYLPLPGVLFWAFKGADGLLLGLSFPVAVAALCGVFALAEDLLGVLVHIIIKLRKPKPVCG